jgi:hypothetical protein
MTVKRSTRIPTEHARHDRLIVTRFAGDDSYPTELDEARALVANCPDCARLADDIRLLMAATSELPTPPRPRDFRLSREQAESLRGSFLERLLRPLAAPRLAVLRPVAGVAMSFGVALAVAGVALPTTAPASAPEQPTRLESESADNRAPAPGAGVPEGDVEGQAAPDDPVDRAYTTESDDKAPAEGMDLAAQPADQMRSLVLYAGIALAAFSLAILMIVTFARRRSYDRLLR